MRVLDARQGSPIAREALLETEIDGRTVVFDLMDGYFYNDPAAVQALFSRADVVFKRSCFRLRRTGSSQEISPQSCGRWG